MKTTNKVLALSLLLAATSQAATTISGVVGTSFKAADGTTNITTGSLVMLIADTSGNGFLDLASPGAIQAGLSGRSGNTITVAQAGLSAGLLFGGDTIVTTSLSGSGSIGGILTGVDITSYTGKNFAIVWFNATPAALATSLAGQAFGMLRLSDWVLPASGATFAVSSTDTGGATTYYSSSASATATQIGSGFFTGSGTAADTGSTAVRAATFSIAGVPEPSTALLGSISILGLLRRRRN